MIPSNLQTDNDIPTTITIALSPLDSKLAWVTTQAGTNTDSTLAAAYARSSRHFIIWSAPKYRPCITHTVLRAPRAYAFAPTSPGASTSVGVRLRPRLARGGGVSLRCGRRRSPLRPVVDVRLRTGVELELAVEWGFLQLRDVEHHRIDLRELRAEWG